MTEAHGRIDPSPWHGLDPATVLEQLGVEACGGLSTPEVAERRAQCGANAIRPARRRGAVRIVLGQFADLMILVLIGAAVVSGVIGDAGDTLVILAIILLNGAIGAVQELRAERALAALRRLDAGTAAVLRDGAAATIPAEDLVPGDIVLLEAGRAVPADLRLIEAHGLQLGEAALTGESLPVEKGTAAIPDPALPLADRRNMAFKGTAVLDGRGRGVVVATGMATALGGIAGMLDTVEATRTPLQRRLTRFGRQITAAALLLCAIILGLGIARGEPPLLMLLTALSLAVAAIPEALPAVVTVLLALGARRMAAENALIRRLSAVETLGSVTVIGTDKTGTLTRNEMQATALWTAEGKLPVAALDVTDPAGRRLLSALALCNEVVPDAAGQPRGEPTEIALWRLAAAHGVDKAALERTAPRLGEIPFDSGRRRMATLHRGGEGCDLYVKGAPESVLPLCRAIAAGRGEASLNRPVLAQALERMASEGLRVLALAWRRCPVPLPQSEAALERDLTLLGFVGLFDPARPEARAAVATCRAAGITPIMITGDHPATALTLARQVGIATAEEDALTGRELAMLSDAELQAQLAGTRVFARVDPAQKLRIVAALQARGEVVAMTGDGVNDAPALARAEIGVAMGRGGTDVAREAAGLVLLDDNFATIVGAVREGRRIFDNIRKFVRYAVTCNSAEIWTIFLAPFLGLPVPLLPIQILWINLVTDGLPGLALAAEPAEAGVMQRRPRPPEESVFAQGLGRHVIWVGLLMAAVVLAIQAWGVQEGNPHWQTMVFTVLTLSQMGHVLAIRSERESLFRLGLRSNRPLLGAVTLTCLLQVAVVMLPPLNPLFGTAPLTAEEWAVCGLASCVVFVAVEIEKWMGRRKEGKGSALDPAGATRPLHPDSAARQEKGSKGNALGGGPGGEASW
ncbi:Calcium-transporting ATPase [Rhodovastum atsumiense]|uniref:Cation-translocating P-type ATPase n=1 Tax=Rhodovastum atsumiense TaxID=504468 RepID=A0A5M6ISZ9_9PROT|nr:cation-translocating P-type ATPase [Rhodovastum atsumiense]KAA5611382.1 cation-translocating P-type ATPase [Rhodovastum atsumiense]CAH2603612.1 Calcium-transporting ATPase [Rhodovastum atsumiense]